MNKTLTILLILFCLISTGCKDVHYPDIPVNVVAKKTTDGCLLTWEPSAADKLSGETDDIYYMIFRSVNINGSYSLIEVTDEGETSFLDNSVEQGRIYSYIIYAYWDHYYSDPSLPVVIDYTVGS